MVDFYSGAPRREPGRRHFRDGEEWINTKLGLVGSGRGGKRVDDGESETLRQSACLLVRKLHFIRKRAADLLLSLDRHRTVVSRPQRISILILVLRCVIVTCSADI
jgi:hypothetical protein